MSRQHSGFPIYASTTSGDYETPRPNNNNNGVLFPSGNHVSEPNDLFDEGLESGMGSSFCSIPPLTTTETQEEEDGEDGQEVRSLYSERSESVFGSSSRDESEEEDEEDYEFMDETQIPDVTTTEEEEEKGEGEGDYDYELDVGNLPLPSKHQYRGNQVLSPYP